MTDRGEDVVTILVTGCARGGEVLAADVVRQLAGTVPGLPLHPRGEVTLKGFPEGAAPRGGVAEGGPLGPGHHGGPGSHG